MIDSKPIYDFFVSDHPILLVTGSFFEKRGIVVVASTATWIKAFGKVPTILFRVNKRDRVTEYLRPIFPQGWDESS